LYNSFELVNNNKKEVKEISMEYFISIVVVVLLLIVLINYMTRRNREVERRKDYRYQNEFAEDVNVNDYEKRYRNEFAEDTNNDRGSYEATEERHEDYGNYQNEFTEEIDDDIINSNIANMNFNGNDYMGQNAVFFPEIDDEDAEAEHNDLRK